MLVALAAPVLAQPAAVPPSRETSSPLPPVPARSPRPPAEINAFAGPLSTNDASIEVPVGESEVLNLKEELRGRDTIAVGDPSIVNFTVLNTRQLRLVGGRLGVTDLAIVTADGRVYSFEVHVVADLDPLRLQLRALFPEAVVKLSQVRDNIVVEGEARDSIQVARIMETVRAYVYSIFVSEGRLTRGGGAAPRIPGAGVAPGPAPEPVPLPTPRGAGGQVPAPPPAGPVVVPSTTPLPQGVTPELGGAAEVQGVVRPPTVINLLRVPTSQQVLLKVRIASLNRSAMRQIGADFLAVDHDTGAIVGTQIGGTGVSANTTASFGLAGLATNTLGATSTLFGIFQKGDFDIFLSALRRNNLTKILAEPNLVAMNGHQASFLAGGEFPVPVAQPGTSGGAAAVSVSFQEFGVRLGFLPYILDDDTIRLTVDPEVSNTDFALGATLVPGGTRTPGIDSRKAHTTVELHQGQTLAIAGLMQLELDGTSDRIPLVGDLPFVGQFFSNTTSTRTETELLVLVTPYIIEPMNPEQVPPSPGDEVKEPNDLEFYFLNRMEGRTGRDQRSTVKYDDPLHIVRCMIRLERDHVSGPHGYCE